MTRARAAALILAGAVAVPAVAAAGTGGATYEGHTTHGGKRVTLTLTTRANGTASIKTGSGGFPVSCDGGTRIRSELQTTVRVHDDGSFSKRKTVRFATRVTGAATARETYRGRVSGSTAHLTHATTIKGAKVDCRATLRWSLRRTSG